jgi:hypothetical protein
MASESGCISYYSTQILTIANLAAYDQLDRLVTAGQVLPSHGLWAISTGHDPAVKIESNKPIYQFSTGNVERDPVVQ